MDRRTFIRSATAAAVISKLTWAAAEHRIQKIGLEMYTVRDGGQKDLEGTVARVAKIGYKEVEFGQYFAHIPEFNPSPKRTREILEADGLAAPSTHVPYSALAPENWPKVIEASKTLGHDYIVNPSIDREVLKQPDGWKRAAETFNRAGEESQKAGIQFAYHNHVEEFKPTEDGRLPYDILLSESDPKVVKMEMDLGWAHKAGADILAYFN